MKREILFRSNERVLKASKIKSFHYFYKSDYQNLNQLLEKQALTNKTSYDLIHLTFNYALLSEGIEIDEEKIIALWIKFEDVVDVDTKDLKIQLSISKEFNKTLYEKQFNQVQEHLNLGNCYQINLTQKMSFNLLNNIEYHSFFNADVRGKYSHVIRDQKNDFNFFSNSPECLFEIRPTKDGHKLYSAPIKGTMPFENDEQINLAWQKLTLSKKDQAELFMIADLLRNDLSKIEKPAAKIVKKKAPLIVPGLIHQYSLIEVGLTKAVSLLDVVSATFPGGSITGAPKKNVISFIHDIETEDRDSYCGSTIMIGPNFASASINIRSLEVSERTQKAHYGSGGGVTLLSEKDSEFTELENKANSFLSAIGLNLNKLKRREKTCNINQL